MVHLIDKKPKFREGDSIQFKGFGHNRYTIKEVCGLSHYINTVGNRMDMSYTDANFDRATNGISNMKSNEAPEKIWVHELSAKELNVPLKEHHVEYIREDAFIEKAERYIRSVADGLDRDDDVEAFISEFIKYMKGE